MEFISDELGKRLKPREMELIRQDILDHKDLEQPYLDKYKF